MIRLIPKYIEITRVLRTQSLANRIRQNTWSIDNLLRYINNNMRNLKKKISELRKNQSKIQDIQKISSLLASEFKVWMVYLKYIYFYNSCILHLYCKYLIRTCKKTKTAIKNLKKKEVLNLHIRKKEIFAKRQIRMLFRDLNKEHKIGREFVKTLRQFKDKTNKEVRHGFCFRNITLLQPRRLDQKIRIKVRHIKKLDLERIKLMNHLDQIVDPLSINKTIIIFHKVIKDIRQDMMYVRKLIYKLKIKKSKVESDLRDLGKKIKIPTILRPFIDLDQKIDNDFKEMAINALQELNREALRLKGNI